MLVIMVVEVEVEVRPTGPEVLVVEQVLVEEEKFGKQVAVLVELVMQISMFSLPSLLMQVCLVVKAVVVEVAMMGQEVLVELVRQVFLRLNQVRVMEQEVMELQVAALVVVLVPQEAQAATAEEQQDFV